MSDTIKYTAAMLFKPAKGYRLVERDMIVVRADGTVGIVRAGTKLPLYDEEITVTSTEQ